MHQRVAQLVPPPSCFKSLLRDPLGVGVDVHLHHACLDGVADVLQGGAGAAVEDEGHRLVAVAAQLLLAELEEKLDLPSFACTSCICLAIAKNAGKASCSATC